MQDMTRTMEAPELIVDRWFNTDRPLTLAALRGRVVFLHAFQMLCPGCVSHGTPQAQKAHQVFQASGLQVIGLHTVFEHHAAMAPVSLEAFIHEYKLSFPIAVDRPGDPGPLPRTMQAYAFQGTPSAVIVGRDGRICHRVFGAEDDMVLGARLAAALSEP